MKCKMSVICSFDLITAMNILFFQQIAFFLSLYMPVRDLLISKRMDNPIIN